MEKEVFKIGGKAINELRVVDLKKELESRGLSKSGSKTELIKRLKAKMRIERLHSDASEDEIPNRKLSESVGEQSDFVKQYLEKQQRTYTQMRHEKEQYQVLKKESENEQSDSDTFQKHEGKKVKRKIQPEQTSSDEEKSVGNTSMGESREEIQQSDQDNEKEEIQKSAKEKKKDKKLKEKEEKRLREEAARKEIEDARRLKEEEEDRLLMEEERIRKEKEEERIRKEKEEERIRKEKEEEKIRKEKEEERIRKEKEEERIRKEKEEERMRKEKEEEKMRKEKEEERMRKEKEEEKMRKEKEEEKMRKEKEEERIRKEKEKERIRKEKEERIRKEKEEEMIRKEEEEERIRKEKEEERIRKEKEEERIRKEKEEERIRKEKEEERIRKEKEEERIRKEKEERILKEKEGEMKKLEQEKSKQGKVVPKLDEPAVRDLQGGRQSNTENVTSSSSSSEGESDSKSESTAERQGNVSNESEEDKRQDPQDDINEEKFQVSVQNQLALGFKVVVERIIDISQTKTKREERELNQRKQLPKRITSSSIKEMFGHIKPQPSHSKITTEDSDGEQHKVLTSIDDITRTIVQDVKRTDDFDLDESNEISMEVGSDTSDGVLESRNDARVVEFKKDGDHPQITTKRKPISPPSSESASKKRIVSTTRQSSKLDIDDSLKPIKEKSPSPARHPTSRVLLVRNLVRPFTVSQLKNILSRHGPIIDEYFWIDNIKTHCYSMYETQELAVETRDSLHNSRWPSSNPKLLTVDFATEEDIYRHLLSDKPDIAKTMDIAKGRADEEISRSEKPEEENPPKRWTSKDAEERDRDRNKERDRGFEKENRERGRREHVREWDRGKLRHSPSPQGPRRVERGHNRSRSPRRRSSPRRQQREERVEKPADAPAKLLDDLFHKTEASPSIYWLPLSDEGARIRDENRKKEKEDREQKRRDREEDDRQRRRKDIYDNDAKSRHDGPPRRRRRVSSSD
ncbi:DgyrCDS6688 [Dimorphilus gyrociliatus]|uniref:DgyrCDS6688 n=1 Tax=Dimorphilus gyrociliatus TaxID=2664684 RepID=A0A7I8VR21_9ANNE|nr:DgyrCDS6688 [Dimorphilus gyrociliatus]